MSRGDNGIRIQNWTKKIHFIIEQEHGNQNEI